VRIYFQSGNFLFLVVFLIFFGSFLTFAGDRDEYAVFEENQKKGLANKNGRVLIPPEYDDLGWTNGSAQLLVDVIGFKQGDLWGILNTRNEKITEPIYTSLTRFNESWIVAAKKLPYNSNIVYGVINSKGKAEIAFQYHNLQVHGSHIIVTQHQEGKFLFGVFDDRAKLVLPVKYDRVNALNENLYEVILNDKVAVFNNKGKGLTDFVLDSVQLKGDDLLITHQNGKRGLIAKNGQFIVEPQYKDFVIDRTSVKAQKFAMWQAYDHANQLKNTYYYDHLTPKGKGIYSVAVGAAEALIHESDSLLSPFTNFQIQAHFENYVAIKRAGRSGVMHLNGKMFLEPVYDSIRYERGIFLVKTLVDGKRGWNMVDLQGKIVTSHVYDELHWLGDSYFSGKRSNYWGVVNNQGRENVFCKYDSVVAYTEGKLLVKFLGEDGILNLDESWEILPQKKDIEIVDPIRYLIRSPYGSYVAFYPDTKQFTAEYFLYKHGNRYLEKTLDLKYGLLDEYGKRVIKPEFDEISELQSDSIYYARAGNAYSFITRSGKILVSKDPRFQEIHDMREEFIGVKIDNRWGFVDMNGKLRIANRYDNVGQYNEGLAPIRILSRWGYVNKREEIIVQPAYDTVYSFTGGVCEVVKKGKYGLIDAQGKITLECDYDDITRIGTGGFLIEKDQKIGLAGRDGRLLILPRFDKVTDLNNGFIIASRNGKYGMFSNTGVSIIPMIYEDLRYDKYNDLYLAANPAEWLDIRIP
jgi:hypothetical protein